MVELLLPSFDETSMEGLASHGAATWRYAAPQLPLAFLVFAPLGLVGMALLRSASSAPQSDTKPHVADESLEATKKEGQTPKEGDGAPSEASSPSPKEKEEENPVASVASATTGGLRQRKNRHKVQEDVQLLQKDAEEESKQKQKEKRNKKKRTEGREGKGGEGSRKEAKPVAAVVETQPAQANSVEAAVGLSSPHMAKLLFALLCYPMVSVGIKELYRYCALQLHHSLGRTSFVAWYHS